MKIIVGGGTGLIGKALVPELIASGYEVYLVSRDKSKIKKIFQNTVHANTWSELNQLNPDEFMAIINLTGENISDHRWSSKIKSKLLSSRLHSTQQFVDWGVKAQVKTPHLYNASAIGIYGLQTNISDKNKIFTEKSDVTDSTKSFSSTLVSQWEQAALQGTHVTMPVTLMRFGVVLKRHEGMLKKLELPTQYGMGAVVGSGEQPLAWIDHIDLVQGILFLITHSEITGPVNLVAPECVSQKTFATTLANVLNKSVFIHLPTWFVKLALGQMGTELLLSGQAVSPQRLLEYKFRFKYPTLLAALTKEYESP